MDNETTTGTETSTTENPSTGNPNPTDTSTTGNPPPSDADETIDLGKTGDEPDGKPGEGEGGEGGDDQLTDEQKAAEEARAALFGAPEGDAGYEIDGLPEGMEIDTEALAAVTPAFKELGLSNAGASKIAQVYAEHVLPKVADQFKSTLEQNINDQRQKWASEAGEAVRGFRYVFDDKGEPVMKDGKQLTEIVELKTATGDKIDFGGAGIKQVTQIAAKALDRIAPAGFREYLDETGLGQHPAMVAFAFRVGQLVSEDSDFGGGGGGDPKPKSRTELYYNR